MPFTAKWVANPFIKTTLSQIGGALGASVVSAIDSALAHPSGGLQEFLTAHPLWFVGYSIGVGIVHNTISSAFPPGGFPPEPKGTTVDPNSVSHYQ